MNNLKHLYRLVLPYFVATCFLAAIPLSSNIAHGQTIDWEVSEPFRFIKYDEGSVHWKIPRNKTASEFIEGLMATGDRTKLPPFEKTQYIRDSKRGNTMRFPHDYGFPKQVRVSAWVSDAPAGLCKWKYHLQSGEFNCKERFEFDAKTQFGDGDTKLIVTMPDGEPIGQVEVLVTDRLVLGLGDSFASGQGNPDKPAEADPEKLAGLARKNGKRIINGRWMKISKAKRNWLKSPADWLDKQCHRSLFGQHVLAAMRLAANNPKESVTLMPFGCSGAEVLDGLLIPQKEPPFGKKPVADSQVNLAIRHLCPSGRFTTETKVYLRGESGKEKPRAIPQELLRCEGGVRIPDAIFLSIGGNDVGFAPAIAWAAIPDKGRNIFGSAAVRLVAAINRPVCPADSGTSRCRKNSPPANYRIHNWLPKYYQYLMEELRSSGLAPDGRRIYLTSYPDPTLKEDGNTVCDFTTSEDSNEQIRSTLPSVVRPTVWELGFSTAEAHKLRSDLIFPLAATMKAAAEEHKWNFVDAHVVKMKRSGLCANYERTKSVCDSEADNPAPMYPHIRNGCWHPKRPDREWAYDISRKRWFRNTNDSILFQYDGTFGSIKGAFHPDFRAHALMADELFDAVRTNWHVRTEKE